MLISLSFTLLSAAFSLPMRSFFLWGWLTDCLLCLSSSLCWLLLLLSICCFMSAFLWISSSLSLEELLEAFSSVFSKASSATIFLSATAFSASNASTCTAVSWLLPAPLVSFCLPAAYCPAVSWLLSATYISSMHLSPSLFFCFFSLSELLSNILKNIAYALTDKSLAYDAFSLRTLRSQLILIFAVSLLW